MQLRNSGGDENNRRYSDKGFQRLLMWYWKKKGIYGRSDSSESEMS